MPGQIHNAPFLDCCAGRQVASIRLLYQGNHDCEALCQCQTCGAYWFYRFHEYVNFAGGDDDQTVWYSRLTPEQGKLILESPERPEMPFLSHVPSFVKDRDGVRPVTGQPTYPWM